MAEVGNCLLWQHFLQSKWVLYPMDKKLELMWVIFLRPSINYRQQKCHRFIWMSLKFVNQFLNTVYKTAKDVNTCFQGNGLPDS